MPGNNGTVSGSMEDAARTAKVAARAAAKAISGNYAEAAKELLSNPEELKKIILIALTPLIIMGMLLVTVMYILPMAVYEAAENAVITANESYLEAYYNTNKTGLAGEIKGVTYGVANWIRDFTAALVGHFSDSLTLEEQNDPVYRTSDIISADSQIVSTIDAHIISLWNKMEQIQAKYKKRVDDITKAITESEASEKIRVSIQNRKISTKDLLTIQAFEKFEQVYDPEWDIFNSATWLPAYIQEELTPNEQLHVAVFYDTINDNDFNATKFSDFIRWLGYGTASGDKLYLNILGEECELKGWTGIYMPQYLLDEARQISSISGEKAKKEKAESFRKWYYRIIHGNESDEDKSEAIQKAYDKAYRKTLEAYYTEYGVSLVDMLIYAYTGKLVQTEKAGPENKDYNLMVFNKRHDRIISAKEYGTGHPDSTYDDWEYEYGKYKGSVKEDYGNMFLKMRKEYGLGNDLYKAYQSEKDKEPDGEHEGYYYYKRTYQDREYTRKVSCNFYYSGGYWYYVVDGTTYKDYNPLYNNRAAQSAFQSACSPSWYSSWGYRTAVYDSYGTAKSVSFTFEEKYTVKEPKMYAEFYKYYYIVDYACPYYIAFRPESEMLNMSGFLDGDYTAEYEKYLKTKNMLTDDEIKVLLETGDVKGAE